MLVKDRNEMRVFGMVGLFLIHFQAYSPLARPYRQAEHGVTAKLDDSRLKAVAEQVNKTPAQVR